jgi:ABC-type antimicrobial peptide transport system permease subunit
MGLSIGIACTILIGLWIRDEMSFDRYHQKADQIYRVIYEKHNPGQVLHSAVSPIPLGPELKQSIPEIGGFTRFSRFFDEVLLSYGDKRFLESNGAYADPGYFKMFSVAFLSGDPDRVFDEPNAVVITEDFAEKYFGDIDPVNKVMQLEGFFDLKVTGVIKNIPANSHLKYDFIVPIVLFERWGMDISDWNSWGTQYTYVLLNSDTDQAHVDEKIEHFLKRIDPETSDRLYLQPLTRIHLFSFGWINYDNYSSLEDINFIYLFIAIGMIILIIASINFVNLTTARSMLRSREIGLRKVLGANRMQLVIQFLCESFLIILIAFHISLVLAELFRPLFSSMMNKEIEISYFDPLFIRDMAVLLLITTLLAGAYPAFYLSAYQPIKVIRGMLVKGRQNVLFRRALVVVQYALAVAMILFSIMIFKQFSYINSKDLGFNSENVLYIQLRGQSRRNYSAFLEELKQVPAIKGVTGGANISTLNASNSDNADWPGKEPGESFEVLSSYVNFGFTDMFDIRIVEGRDFSREMAADSTEAFLVNEMAVSMMGLSEPVGAALTFNGEQGRIIGVMKDYHHSSLYFDISPVIMAVRKSLVNYLFIKLNRINEETIGMVREKWESVFPDYPFEYGIYDNYISEVYRPEQQTAKIINAFTILAIFISIIGLIGLASYEIERRTREIGIRKVNGAGEKEIITLLTGDFLKWVVVAIIIGTPLAWFFIGKWLDRFAFRTSFSWWVFLATAAIVLLMSILTIVFRAWYAARINPVEALRYE